MLGENAGKYRRNSLRFGCGPGMRKCSSRGSSVRRSALMAMSHTPAESSRHARKVVDVSIASDPAGRDVQHPGGTVRIGRGQVRLLAYIANVRTRSRRSNCKLFATHGGWESPCSLHRKYCALRDAL